MKYRTLKSILEVVDEKIHLSDIKSITETETEVTVELKNNICYHIMFENLPENIKENIDFIMSR